MFHVKYAVTIVQENTMAFLHVTVVLASLNVQYDAIETMCANQNRKDIVWSTRHIGINVERVDCVNVLKLA